MKCAARLLLWARSVRQDVHALYLAARDPRVPWYVKAIAIGVVLSVAGSRVIKTMLFGVSDLDLRVFGAACLILTAATVLASYLPARRASKTDPLISLRAE